MPTIDHYRGLLESQHFTISAVHDWSKEVSKSWDVGIKLYQRYSFLQLLRLAGLRRIFQVSKQIKLMQEAFYQNWIRYGVLIAKKSANETN